MMSEHSGGKKVRLPAGIDDRQQMRAQLPSLYISAQGVPTFQQVYNPIGIDTETGCYTVCERDGRLEVAKVVHGQARIVYPLRPDFLLTLAGCRLSKTVDEAALCRGLDPRVCPPIIPVVPMLGTKAIDIEVSWHKDGEKGVLPIMIVEE